jgi:hypothetical protein
MKRFFLSFLACLPLCAFAQAGTVPVTAVLTWQLPTTASDGSAPTGALALTQMQVFASTNAIADTSAATATAALAGNATTYTYTTTVPNGTTLHFRVKACNQGGCGPFSNEATKLVSVPTPGAPGLVQVVVTITTQAP